MESINTYEYRYGARCTGASIARLRYAKECDSSFRQRGSIPFHSLYQSFRSRKFTSINRYNGDSYNNALAETVNGLYKTEMIEYLKADWQGLADVQLATLNWVDWFNKKRVHSALGYVSSFEFEAMYYDKINPLGQVA
ncbi:hypothetical protein Asch01_02977 [Acinetobacter schindleri]